MTAAATLNLPRLHFACTKYVAGLKEWDNTSSGLDDLELREDLDGENGGIGGEESAITRES